MEPRHIELRRGGLRPAVEQLEERIAPAHVDLPAAPGIAGHHHEGGPSAAPDHNPHFSGTLRPAGRWTLGDLDC